LDFNSGKITTSKSNSKTGTGREALVLGRQIKDRRNASFSAAWLGFIFCGVCWVVG